ncbi:Serine/threonine-protein phosphatase PGAM5, mitochondrial [Merluccius polli]|uniref:Serine/threonine-protein phosphatase PGAM5, mitochondrial n=1 Tax=Merluccius polli TaxID=89951 RepID=A0AA47P6Q9_MERPO|nr:Serine/threonine-protein phosphatase PGAM5, mitochondrial [Merluccius polli]
MSYRRTLRLLCGAAGAASTALLLSRLGDQDGDQDGDQTGLWSRSRVLQAAQPTWPTANHTPLPSGPAWDFNWDKRDPSALSNGKKKEKEELSSEPEKPKATRNILLIRHSQYHLSGTGDKEKVLTPLGREQAELTGQRLAALGLKYETLVHSSMSRATETANIISKHLQEVELVSCDLLREGAPIEPVPPVTHWKPDAVQYHEDGARIEAAFRRYIHRADAKQKEDSYEIIVCHANVIRYFVCSRSCDPVVMVSFRALQFPPEGWLRMGLNNGSITWLTVRPSGRVGLRTLGDSGFMPVDKLTRT